MYWKDILEANRFLRKALKHEAKISEKLMENPNYSAVLASYYMGKKDAYKDAASRVNDLINSYRVR